MKYNVKYNVKLAFKLFCGLCFLVLLNSFPSLALAVQKAKIVSPEVEIYMDADFDSEIISAVREGETYLISDKTYGPFYRIKLKNGKIGYIVDYELDIEGKGRFKEKDLDYIMYEEAKKASAAADSGDAEEIEVFGRSYSGLTLQSINFHENTLGGVQVDDLPAIGYKKIGDVAWSILGTVKAPKYYTDKTGGSAKGLKLWADLGISSNIVDFGDSGIRLAGAFFTQLSLIQVVTPARKYDLHDVTLGVVLEVGWLIKINKNAIDLVMKYYFDKANYAGLGLSILF